MRPADHVRAAPPLRDPATRALAALVGPLTARVRREELQWLAAWASAAPGDPAALARALAHAVRHCRAVRTRLEDRAGALRASVAGTEGLARREALARHVRVTVPPGRARRADLRALDRDLDLDALLEREAAGIEREGARIEVAVEALAGLAGEVAPPAWAATGADALLGDLLTAERRLPTRRAVCRGMVRILRAQPRGSARGHRAVLALRARMLDPAEDTLVRRAAVEVATALPAMEAAAWLESALGLVAGPECAFVRARAGALAVALPRPAGRELVHRALGDPTEIVPAETIEALARSDDPDARGLLGTLVEDPRGHVRARAASHLEPPPPAPEGVQRLAAELAGLRPGEARHLRDVDPLGLAEALVPHARAGFGFHLEPLANEVRVVRGDLQVPRLWRFLHEVRHPAPSKRQGKSHLVGRADRGRIRVPPFRLAEESSTGVPGERLVIPARGGWAPHVPMVDDLLDATVRGEVVLVTAEGALAVRRPRAPWRAYARLVVDYARYDALRTASLAESAEAGRYLDAVRALGFELGAPRPQAEPPAVALGTLPIAWLLGLGTFSVTHLALVLAMFWTLLFGRAAAAKWMVRRARRRLPLVVGGWGTRGKSGTERLKAAVFEGLGVPMFSKTTGCEAMVLHGPPGGRAVELFLFRPFDKATIWEQVRVVRLAAALGARTMLWECMGLNPAYVRLLQDGWMRDDLSTLTNAYPDHEDIQGPTGLDVATVLGGFAPPDALVITTEEHMLAVLTEEARKKGCVTRALPRRAWEAIPRELLQRLPHAEHPANVALAASAAAAVGVDPTDAMWLMGGHVVPDLGALVVYPRARHLQREVVFANGMSANDTLSFRHNWRHLGCGRDRGGAPDEWLVTVVNNRADRVARSRVFAAILVNDADAQRHVFIGTNLRGLATYVEEALDEKLATVALASPEDVDRLYAHLRLVEPGALGAAVARKAGRDAEAWLAAVGAWAPGPVRSLSEGRSAAERLRPPARDLEAALGLAGLADTLVEAAARQAVARAARTAPADLVRELYRALTRAAIVVVEDAGATGDKVMATAIAAVPPGCTARIVGVQNIKGTGLDFAYQWVWWRELHRALGELRDPAGRPEALDSIERNPLGSALACEAALEALHAYRDDPRHGARVTTLHAQVAARRDTLLAARKGGKVAKRFAGLRWLLERLVDPFDAILRARRASRVFDDLAAMRISHGRAQAELKRLTERQKGGWLG